MPAQVLWINLVTNGLQDVALAFEKEEPGLLKQAPRDPSKGVLDRDLTIRLGWITVFIAAVTLAAFWWLLEQDLPIDETRTVMMTLMVMFQLSHVFNSRSFRPSVFRILLGDDRFLVVTVLGALLAHVAVLYVPLLQTVFHTVPLSLDLWLLAIVVGFTVVPVVEVAKAVQRRRET